MSYKGKLPIYMDYQATTPIDPRVFEVMKIYFLDKFGNPNSSDHSYGQDAKEGVEKAREQVADLISASANEVIFTSGATESNYIAIKGVPKFYRRKKNHVITVCTEHNSLLEACNNLEDNNFNVTYLPVKSNGLIDLADLEKSITDKTVLVSVMAVNNEIGVIQPLKEIGEICRKNQVFFHTDAAQAFGKINLNVEEMNIDLMSISGHKIYGPKGVGALYIRRRPKVQIISDRKGIQEKGIRSGTLAVPLIAGLGEAASIAKKEMKDESKRLLALEGKLAHGIEKSLDNACLNGSKTHKVAGLLNYSFPAVDRNAMLAAMPDLAVSYASACTSSKGSPSHVLKNIGIENNLLNTAIRFGIGRFTTDQEIDYAINHITKAVNKCREH